MAFLIQFPWKNRGAGRLGTMVSGERSDVRWEPERRVRRQLDGGAPSALECPILGLPISRIFLGVEEKF